MAVIKSVPMTKEERLKRLLAGVESKQLSKQSQLQSEFLTLVQDLQQAYDTHDSTFKFWATLQIKYPIFSRIAARTFLTTASNTDVERFFNVNEP